MSADRKLSRIFQAIEKEGFKILSIVEADDRGRIEIRIKDLEYKPPDLGIHIQDGIGTEDKVGG
jgi:hypothetical protein